VPSLRQACDLGSVGYIASDGVLKLSVFKVRGAILERVQTTLATRSGSATRAQVRGPDEFSALTTFTSVTALINRIRAYVEHWNTDAEPFAWTATGDEILAKVRWVEANVKQLVAKLEVTGTQSHDTRRHQDPLPAAHLE
jgi:hypothetical protein